MEREAAEAKYEALHKERPYHDGRFTSWGKTRTERHPYHFREGVTIWVDPRDLTPDDNFLTAGGGKRGDSP